MNDDAKAARAIRLNALAGVLLLAFGVVDGILLATGQISGGAIPVLLAAVMLAAGVTLLGAAWLGRRERAAR